MANIKFKKIISLTHQQSWRMNVFKVLIDFILCNILILVQICSLLGDEINVKLTNENALIKSEIQKAVEKVAKITGDYSPDEDRDAV